MDIKLSDDMQLVRLESGKLVARVTDEGLTVETEVLLDPATSTPDEMRAYFRFSVVPELLKKMRRAHREKKDG